jgi:crossover junction endodeoxyribonuclease RusA
MGTPDPTSIPFPLEIVVEGTPVSAQGSPSARDAWKRLVSEEAKRRLQELTDWYWLEERPLSVTIFYFAEAPMEGDIDNIVKPILDAMKAIVYHDDNVVERVLVQRFEPGIAWSFATIPGQLVLALEKMPPVVYIRIEGDLAWRHVP